MAKNNIKEITIEEYNKKNIEYWEDVEKKKLKKQLKNIDKIQQELKTQYIRAQKEINAKISDLYMRYMEQNELSFAEANKLLSSSEYKEWKKDLAEYIKLIEETGDPQLLLELNTLAMKSRISRLEESFYQIDKQINSMYADYHSNVEIFLKDSVKDSYYQSIYSVQKYFGQGSAFGLLDNNLIETVINYPWSGRNFSSVIWENRDKLKRTIKNEMTQMIIQGKGSKEVAKNIAGKMNSDFKHALRVVNTEHSYIMGEASANGFKETGVEYYQFLSTLDTKTSEVCQQLDLKIFKLEERKVGINASPMHPNCRSTEIPYFKYEDGETRIARGADGKNYSVPSNMKYEDWYKQHIGPKTEDGVEIKFNDVKEKDIKEPEKIKAKPKTTKAEPKKTTNKAKVAKAEPKKTTDKAKVAKTKEPKLPKFKKPEAYKQQYGYEMHQLNEEWYKTLSESQKENIKKYTNQGWYSTINKPLRLGDLNTRSEQTQKLLKPIYNDISTALSNAKAPKNMQVYRGSSASLFKSLLDEETYNLMRNNKASVDVLKEKLLGTIVKDEAYMSTTLNPYLLRAGDVDFLKNTFFKIDVDKNAKGCAYIGELSESTMETEFLLDKGTKLYIKDIVFNKEMGTYDILCHYLGQ